MAGVLFGLMLVGAIFEVIGVGAIPVFVGLISAPERMLEFTAVRTAFERLDVTTPRAMVMWSAVGLIVLYLVKNVYLTFLAYAQARYTTNREVQISNRLFRAYMYSPYTFHLQRNTAELLRNTSKEAGAITSGVLMPLLTIAMELLVLGMVFALLVATEPLLSLLAGGLLGITTLLFYRFTRERISSIAKEEQVQRSILLQAVSQGLSGIKDTKILGRESFFLRTFAASTDFKARAERFRTVLGALPRLFLETLAVAGMLGATALLLWQGRPTESLIPSLTLLAVAVVRLMPSFQRLANSFAALKWGERPLEVVYDDMVALEAAAERSRGQSKKAELVPFTRAITLDRVSYAYPGVEGEALREISLTIPRGSAVGFIGPSGAGKTTVVNVILGLLEPAAGRVLVDGRDIHENLAAWQRQIGYISQDIYLTDDTIRRNVAFGLSDRKIDEDAVWRALEAAQLRDLVESQPQGLDTLVGERGIRLSGGQRQRIGIARALYHNPSVLVMDEATSSVDHATESRIVETINRLQGSHTIIIIAHRLSTVRGCDRIYRIEAGRIVAEGSPEVVLMQHAVAPALV